MVKCRNLAKQLNLNCLGLFMQPSACIMLVSQAHIKIVIHAGEEEIPPIPCHVHSGDVLGGRCVGHGKTEAYFFPPLNVPPYNLELDAVKTRLGLRPGTTKEQV